MCRIDVSTKKINPTQPFYDTAVGDENTNHVVDNYNITATANGIKWVRATLDSPRLNGGVPQ